MRRNDAVMISRLTYRSRQFWNALLSPRKPVPSQVLVSHLTPPQLGLFHRLLPAEQTHAFQIYERLKTAGHNNPDLLSAALLHDVGKILQPLSILERIVIVLGNRLFRGAAQRWAGGPARGLRRPFVVAGQHAGWGANLASKAGATTVTVELIRRHHDPHLHEPGSPIEELLAFLQAADDES